MRTGSTLYFLLTDHLGSTAITASSSGAKSAELRYKAWGETRYSYGTTPTDFRYTGQRFESLLGLHFYGARWYDSALGRFVQPDTVVPLEAWDRYAYVNNNPVRYTDPTGHWLDSALDILSIGYGIYDISQNGLNWENGLGLAADIVGLALPAVTGLGAVVRVAARADDTVDVLRTVNQASNILHAGNQAGNLLQSGNQVGNVTQFSSRVDHLADARGGVYRLVDSNTGEVVRTGRSNNLVRRRTEHARDIQFQNYRFDEVWRTDDYAQQRGLEKILHERYNPPLNKIRPISTQNRRINE
jgi:RHS repeat-associated protein